MVSKKQLICVLFLIPIMNFFAEDISNNLDLVKKYYSQGDYTKTIQLLDQIKTQIEKEQFAKSGETYIPLESWNPVKVEPEKYLGKKVKITASFVMIKSDGTVYISGVSSDNTFNKNIKDKIIGLKGYEKSLLSESLP